MEQLQANFKLAVYVFTFIIILLVIVIIYLVASVDELEKQNKDMLMRIFDVQDELNPCECEITLPEKINDLKGQINDLKGMVEKQEKQIENMVFCYASLDEILKNMGIAAQKRYEGEN